MVCLRVRGAGGRAEGGAKRGLEIVCVPIGVSLNAGCSGAGSSKGSGPHPGPFSLRVNAAASFCAANRLQSLSKLVISEF